MLYDGSAGGLPTAPNQNMVFGDNPPGSITPSYDSVNKLTVLNTNSLNLYSAGFSPDYNKPSVAAGVVLDRTKGYVVKFTVQLQTETHAGSDRAGFSVIALGNDTASGKKAGIELGFWSNEIWAQHDGTSGPLLFTHGEGNTTVNPGSSLLAYELEIVGSKYALYLGGSSTPLLSGPLRDYTAFVPPMDFPNIYSIPNFIFLGDDTSQAKAITNIAQVSIDTTALVPGINTQPANQTISSGQTASLSVAANGKASLNYQWYRGNSGDISSPVSGATSSSFVSPSLTTNTNYWVRVSNNINGVTYTADSTTATITVLIVTNPFDNGLGDTFGTLSYALLQVKSGQTISFALTSGNTVAVTGSKLPNIPPGVSLSGSCNAGKPTITIDGTALSSGDGLVLSDGVNLNGLKITHFKGAQIKINGKGNKFTCVVAQR